MGGGKTASRRLANRADLERVVALTDAAYGGYVPLLGGPPFPMTEDCAPRIDRGGIRLYTNARMQHNIAISERYGFRETGRRPKIVDMAKSIPA